MNTRTLLVVAVTLAPAVAAAQNFEPEYNPLYDDSRVATIRITIDPSVLDSILAPGNEQSDYEHPASFEYDDGSTVETVGLIGFRLRGNTSRQSAKKSFKVSFTSWVQGQKFHDVEKLNLNGEHNDPTIIRSKIAWDIFAAHRAPAPRAAHVKLYINDAYYGLYANVEHIDEQFLQSRFGDDSGNLYKSLWPADLAYLGPDAEDYRPTDASRRPYDLKLKDSDLEGYDDLAHFIDVLNNTPGPLFVEEIEKVFDVNGFLRSIAVDILTGSWDNYWFLKNNYYLYSDPRSGLFHYLPYDFDNIMGIWWDDIEPGADWATRDLYDWGSQSEARPLTDRILAHPFYVDRLSFFLDQLLQKVFLPDSLNPRIDALHALVTEAAEADTFRTRDYGYTIDDFHDAFDEALGAHVTWGLKPFIQERRQSALAQLETRAIRPILLDGWYSPALPSSAEPISFYVTVMDDGPGVGAELEYAADGSGGAKQRAPMFDDGTNGDEVAGDGRFAVSLPALENNVTLSYRFVGVEESGRESYSSWRMLDVGFTGPPLFINELMASNDTTIADPFGEYDDWLELYNAGDSTISLAGMWLTDNPGNRTKWAAPDTSIAPGGYLLLWIDDEVEQGPLHAPFGLSAGGETFVIYAADFTAIDAVTFGEQSEDVSFGRTIDGGGRFDYLPVATPGAANISDTGVDDSGRSGSPNDDGAWTLSAYPNPFRGDLTVVVETAAPRTQFYRAPATTLTQATAPTLDVFDLLGRLVTRVEADAAGATTRFHWDGRDATGASASPGVYLIRVVDQRGVAAATTVVVKV